MLEIELKVKVESLDPVRNNLKLYGAGFGELVHEHDIYYNAPHRDFGITDEALRVRYTDRRAVVTYKGAKRKDLMLKAREEINTAVESGPAFETLLHRLGFTKTAEVDKTREYYHLGTVSIALDTVRDLGTFVEIEVIAEEGSKNTVDEIGKIAEKIGAGGQPILASYLELILAKRSGVQP
jgi:adenylate cyclase class 2